MKRIRKILALTCIHGNWYLRNKYWWVGSLIYPLSFYIVLSVIGGVRMGAHALIGALISLIWNSGVGAMPQFLSQFLFSHRFTKLRDMFVAAPIHPLTHMLGAAISVLIASLPPMIVLAFLLPICVHVTIIELAYLIPILLATWIMSSALGFMIAGYINDPTRIGTIAP